MAKEGVRVVRSTQEIDGEKGIYSRIFSSRPQCELSPAEEGNDSQVWVLLPEIYYEIRVILKVWVVGTLVVKENFPDCFYEIEANKVPEWLKNLMPGSCFSQLYPESVH